MRKLLGLLLAYMVMLPNIVNASSITAKVIGVTDGDTVKVLAEGNRQIKIRLYGVDAPESHQPYGSRSRRYVSDAVYGKTVQIEVTGNDKYGRTLGIITTPDGKNLNRNLIANGMAWVYAQYCTRTECTDMTRAEKEARTKKIGLWADKTPIAPWEFRRGVRPTSQTGSSFGDDITIVKADTAYHGNRSSKVFHAPGCRHYTCKNCTVTFKSRDAAIKAGYKPCRICKP